jgi:hypothetical protein
MNKKGAKGIWLNYLLKFRHDRGTKFLYHAISLLIPQGYFEEKTTEIILIGSTYRFNTWTMGTLFTI